MDERAKHGLPPNEGGQGPSWRLHRPSHRREEAAPGGGRPRVCPLHLRRADAAAQEVQGGQRRLRRRPRRRRPPRQVGDQDAGEVPQVRERPARPRHHQGADRGAHGRRFHELPTQDRQQDPGGGALEQYVRRAGAVQEGQWQLQRFDHAPAHRPDQVGHRPEAGVQEAQGEQGIAPDGLPPDAAQRHWFPVPTESKLHELGGPRRPAARVQEPTRTPQDPHQRPGPGLVRLVPARGVSQAMRWQAVQPH
mmetsp:Transcript_5400/g.12926  ORF Transcript_5400/g.12926 Transcript_5400/m.12926 type:complete len:250 (+) Transcript_5400:946-1695(+)